MTRETSDRWCERGILGLSLAILVFGPLALGAVTPPTFLVVQALTLGVLVLWLARLWLGPKPRLLWPPICWAVVGFIIYAVVRYLTADIEYVARQELIRILVYGFLFLAILNNLRRQESAQIVTFTLLMLATGIAFYALYQIFTGSDHVWWYITPYKKRGAGTYICPNHLAGFLEMVLPLALSYTLVGRLKPVTKVFTGYAALAILAGIAVSLSRGGWVSTGVALAGLFAILLFQRNYRLPAAVLLVALVAAGMYVLPKAFMFQARIDELRTSQQDPSGDTRLAMWRSAVQMWQDQPWWGVGPAHFDERFPAYRPEMIQGDPFRTHNDYLNTLADWGVAGTALVLAAWLLLAWGVVRYWRVFRGSSSDLGGRSGSNRFAFLLGAALGLVAILCHSVVDFNMHIPANAILAVTLTAMLSGHLRFATERYWVSSRFLAQAFASVLLLGGVVYLGWQEERLARESYWLAQAERAPDLSLSRIELLKRAAAVEPSNGETAYAIGLQFERLSREGGEAYFDPMGKPLGDYRQLAEKNAMPWFKLGMELNPWRADNPLHYGGCLDWLGRFGESGPYFDRAEQLDPNGYYTLDLLALHYLEMGDDAAAKSCFERSLHLQLRKNPLAQNYLEIVQARMLEAATNEVRAALDRVR